MLNFNTHGYFFVQKIFPYDLTHSHNTSVTLRRRLTKTDDNDANNAYSIAVAHQKPLLHKQESRS